MKKIIKALWLIPLLGVSQLSTAEDPIAQKNDIKLSEGIWNVEFTTEEGVEKGHSFTIDDFGLVGLGTSIAYGKMHDTGDPIGCKLPDPSFDEIISVDILCSTKDIATNYRVYAIKYDKSGLITEGYYGDGPDLITATSYLLEKKTLITGANITLYGGIPLVTEKPPVETSGACGVTYSPELGTFTVPEIVYSGKKYKVTFKNVGNFLFKIENAQGLANTVP